MIYEIIIIVALAVVFVILARKIPGENKLNGKIKISDTPVKKRIWRWKMPSISFELPKITFQLRAKKNITAKEEVPERVQPAKQALPAKADPDKIREADNLLSQGKTEEAEQIYLDLAAKFVNDPKIYNRLGVVYLKQKNYADARDSFLRSIRLDDTESARHYNLAMAYLGMGAVEKGKVSLKKALDIEPGKEKYQRALEKIKKD